MMHASTSPFYPIIASNEISAAMMDGPSGVALTTVLILEAVSFRQTVGRIKRQYAQANDWFFTTWNSTEITDPPAFTVSSSRGLDTRPYSTQCSTRSMNIKSRGVALFAP